MEPLCRSGVIGSVFVGNAGMPIDHKEVDGSRKLHAVMHATYLS